MPDKEIKALYEEGLIKKEIYKAAAPWNQFKEVVPLTEQEMSVEGIKVDDQTSEWYQLDGRKSFGPKRGLNIIRMKDGTTKKVLF